MNIEVPTQMVIHIYLYGGGRMSYVLSNVEVATAVYKDLQYWFVQRVTNNTRTIVAIPEHISHIDTGEIVGLCLEKHIVDSLKEEFLKTLKAANKEEEEPWKKSLEDEDEDEYDPRNPW